MMSLGLSPFSGIILSIHERFQSLNLVLENCLELFPSLLFSFFSSPLIPLILFPFSHLCIWFSSTYHRIHIQLTLELVRG